MVNVDIDGLTRIQGYGGCCDVDVWSLVTPMVRNFADLLLKVVRSG